MSPLHESGGVVQPTDAQTAQELTRIAENLDKAIECGTFTSVCIYAQMATKALRALAVPQAPLQAEPVPVVASKATTECPTCRAPCTTTIQPRGGDGQGWGTTDKERTNYHYATPQAEPAVAEQARFFEGYLCRAWGETDLPVAEVVRDLASVRRFMVREWWGEENPTEYDSNENMGDRVMSEIAAHDWRDEGQWSATFEIGGVSVERVSAALALQSTPPPESAGQGLSDAEPTPEMCKAAADAWLDAKGALTLNRARAAIKAAAAASKGGE